MLNISEKYVYELPFEMKKEILMILKLNGAKGLELRDALNSKIIDVSDSVPVKAIYYNYYIKSSDKNFNREAFFSYLSDKFKLNIDSSYSVLRELFDNLVEYGESHHNTTVNQLAYFIYDIVPEIELEEVLSFDKNNFQNLTNGISVKFDDAALSYIDNEIEYAEDIGNRMYSDEDIDELLSLARKNQHAFEEHASKYASGKDLVILKAAVDNWDFSVEDFNRYDSDVKERFVKIMDDVKPDIDEFKSKQKGR